MKRKDSARKDRAGSADRDADGSPEVGRVIVGGRLFTIVVASEVAFRQRAKSAYRFQIGGEDFVALEAEEDASPMGDNDEIAARLSGRELEIAMLVARGHTTKSIASRLRISEWTVSSHIRRAYAKLDVDNRAAMVYRCSSLLGAKLLS